MKTSVVFSADKAEAVLKSMRKILPFLLLLAGCASRNPYAQHYRPNQPTFNSALHSQPVRMIEIPWHADPTNYLNGSTCLGVSIFESKKSRGKKKHMLVQAEKVGANLVMFSDRHLGSYYNEYVIPYYLPGPVIPTFHQGNVSAFGPSGYAVGSYSGRSYTQMPGTISTLDIPIKSDTHWHRAVFLRHIESDQTKP
jgi:hypothetical protein